VAYCSLLQPFVGDWMVKGLEAADVAAVDNTAVGGDDTTN